MHSYIERRTKSILSTLYNFLEYDFTSQITPFDDKEDEAVIIISPENVFSYNQERLYIFVSKEYLRFYLPDVISFEDGCEVDFEFLNELNIYCDHLKLTTNEEGNVIAEKLVYTGEFLIDLAPMLLIINFKNFVKEIDKLLESFSNVKDFEDRIAPSPEKYTIPISSAVELLGVSKTTVTNWVNTGTIEALKIKGKWLLNQESLQRFKIQWDKGFKQSD
ncbi:helix-turn-helix domain-containing protein [Robertmurraya sp. FSL R5-0851]|uniref:helix-turn-helix domain-containing protein n=1 Tax=Robertmurraya sp. FSL R5-0851 TaxID=2921584 RepID=UPI0030F83946